MNDSDQRVPLLGSGRNECEKCKERMERGLAMIMEINDGVRNGLEIIALSFAHPHELERIRLVKEGAQRVQRALENLSGKLREPQ